MGCWSCFIFISIGNCCTIVRVVVAVAAALVVRLLVVVTVALTVGGQPLWAVGETDDVSVSFQDEDLVLTTGH